MLHTYVSSRALCLACLTYLASSMACESSSHAVCGLDQVAAQGLVDSPADTRSQACEQACGRLVECGAAIGPTGAGTLATCTARCERTAVSAHRASRPMSFVCCAEHPECRAVRKCSAQLWDEGVAAACGRECSCVLDGSLASQGRLAAALHGPDRESIRGLFVRARSAAALHAAQAALRSTEAPQLELLSYGDRLYHLACPDPEQCLRWQNALEGLTEIELEHDRLRALNRQWADDPRLPDSWALENYGQSGGTAGVDARVAQAWDTTMGSEAVVIGVLDDGVDLRHPELGHALSPLNYPEHWRDAAEAGAFAQHGTRSAGVAVAAANNGLGSAGVCPNCSLLPSFIGQSGSDRFQATDREIAERIVQLTDAGAWVISNSWTPAEGDPGFVTAERPTVTRSMAMAAAIEYAEQRGRSGKGTVVLFAAGNGNAEISPYIDFPTVMIVSAVDERGRKAYYSNFGRSVSIAAPSGGLTGGVFTTAPVHDGTPLFDSAFSGTSAACPIVAGVAGLVLSQNPELTAREVRDILMSTASKLDPECGSWQDGRSPFYGAGLVDAARALRLAQARCDDRDACAPRDLPSSQTSCDDVGSARTHSCNSDADCGEGERCLRVKTRYGVASEVARGCGWDRRSICQSDCETRLISQHTGERAAWLTCSAHALTCADLASCRAVDADDAGGLEPADRP